MATSVPIKERIERQLKTNVAAISGIGSVYRMDLRGLAGLRHLDTLVFSGDETAEDGEQGSLGSTIKTMPFTVATLCIYDEADSPKSAQRNNTWQAAIEYKLMADPALTEATTAVILCRASSLRIVSCPRMQVDSDSGSIAFVVAVQGELKYEHDFNNPYIGPGIALLQE